MFRYFLTRRFGFFLMLALLAMTFLTNLGLWQLQRAEEKKDILLASARLARQAPLALKPGMVTPQQYQPLAAEGFFLPMIFLLDNQHYRHQFGYDVLSPVQLASGKVVLIDRGWLSGDTRRQTFPGVVNPRQKIRLSGYAYYPSGKTWVLGPALEKKSEYLAIIETIDTQLISQILHKSVYPFIIRLDKKEANGYIREWPLIAMSPQRHQAYALQWFAMALVILVIFIGLTVKKVNENRKT